MSASRQPSRWFDLRPGPAGKLAFMLHRLSGIALVVYLFVHLAVLNLLRHGAAAWDDFIALVSSPFFLLLDGLVLFGVLLHGLNGLRLTLLGFGKGITWQRPLFWATLALSLALSLAGVWLLWGKAQ